MWSAVEGIAENASKLRGYFDVAQPDWREALAHQTAQGPSLVDLESATCHAMAMLDLLMTKIVEEDRAGEIEYNQSPWVSDLAGLAAHVKTKLGTAFYDYHKSQRSG